MKSKERPFVLFVAEKIYLEVSKIKKNNPDFSNIDAIDAFIGSKTYEKISSGKFHDDWLEELKKNDFIDLSTKKKFLRKQLNYLKCKKICWLNNLFNFQNYILLKVIIH